MHALTMVMRLALDQVACQRALGQQGIGAGDTLARCRESARIRASPEGDQPF